MTQINEPVNRRAVLDPFQVLESELDKHGKSLIDSKSKFETLDDDKKDYLAYIMKNYIDEPVNRREVKARATDGWRKYKESLATARHDFHRDNVMFTVTRIKIDVMRTKYSYKKAQMNLT